MDNNFLKLSIGGLMAVTETALGGNLLESLKILKQHNVTYKDGIKNLYSRNGLYSLLYTGYYPYGFIQSFTKGIPFFYAHMTTKELLLKNNFSNNTSMTISGFIGGFAQGFFIAPTQRIKTLSIMNENISVKEIIKKEKIGIFRGAYLLSLRRSLDWSLRLYTMDKINGYITIQNKELNILFSSFIGGMMGLFTLPLDVVVARYQSSNTKFNILMKDILKKEGINAFKNGLVMRVLYSGWHTLWVAGFGTILYDKYKN
jgi:hypothetical protein